MSRDRIEFDVDAPKDDAAVDALNAYLDAVAVDGQSEHGVAHDPGDGLIAADRRLRALDDPMKPPAGIKERIWEDLMATTRLVPTSVLPAAAMDGQAPTGPIESLPIPASSRRGWPIVPGLEIAAAILLLVGFAGLIGVLSDGGDSGGDLGAVASPASGAIGSPAAGVRPVHLRIEAIDVDAPIEPVADVGLSLPFAEAGPWTVLWDERSSHLGEPGNVLLAGHRDYWDVGPAVFWDLRHLAPGARVEIVGSDGARYVYVVREGQTYPVEELPVETILGPTADERLTLVTETGTFDYDLGEYPELLVIRATRIASAGTATPHASSTPATDAGCNADPRSAQEIAVLGGDPTVPSVLPGQLFPGWLPQLPIHTADRAGDVAGTLPAGADDGVQRTLDELTACRALGGTAGVERIWSLHSDDYFRRYDPGAPPAQSRAWWGGPGEPGTYELAAVEPLRDGRVRAWLVFERNADGSAALGVFVVLAKVGDRWLVDEVAVYGGISDPSRWPPVPLPGECVVAPRSPESIAAIAGTPTTESFGPGISESDDGQRSGLQVPQGGADPETNARVGTEANLAQWRDTTRLLAACINAGDTARRYALYSDDYLRRARLAGWPVPDAASLMAAPEPLPPNERVEAPTLIDGITLPDGRQGWIALDWPSPPDERVRSSEPAFVVFVQDGDRWLIDEVVLQRDAVVVAEPTAVDTPDPSGSATPAQPRNAVARR